MTHSALGGLVSSRDFVDVLVIENNDEFLATAGERYDRQAARPVLVRFCINFVSPQRQGEKGEGGNTNDTSSKRTNFSLVLF